ncbi:MAG: ttdA [Firmicutes bacterium]|nr:ttdA [Bacillota bacterium]
MYNNVMVDEDNTKKLYVIPWRMGRVGKMRVIAADDVATAVADLAAKANYYLPEDIYGEIVKMRNKEESGLGKELMLQLLENAAIAARDNVPICQDTGMAVVFLELGQEVHIDGDLTLAVNRGIAQGYGDSYLRKSVVSDPLFIRKNTGDNTPAVMHVSIVSGDKLKIILAPKGFGSENMSAVRMLKPSDGIDGVKKFTIDTVLAAGANPCPPIVIGMGLGGTMEKAALLAKQALLRPINRRNSNPDYASLEEELLALVNWTGVGPQGLGGTTTALAVNIEYYPTHIAGLPVAININCHATRHAEIIL